MLFSFFLNRLGAKPAVGRVKKGVPFLKYSNSPKNWTHTPRFWQKLSTHPTRFILRVIVCVWILYWVSSKPTYLLMCHLRLRAHVNTQKSDKKRSKYRGRSSSTPRIRRARRTIEEKVTKNASSRTKFCIK